MDTTSMIISDSNFLTHSAKRAMETIEEAMSYIEDLAWGLKNCGDDDTESFCEILSDTHYEMKMLHGTLHDIMNWD